MTMIAMAFLLLAGSAFQAFFPAMAWVGYSTVPVLLSLVVYFALFRGKVAMLSFALLAGMFQDSMTLIPLGYSSFCFAVCVMVIAKYRDLMMVQSPLTHMVVVAGMHAVVTLLLSILLVKDGLIPWQPVWLLLKIPGAIVLGLVTGPVVIAVTRAFEEKLGLVEGNSEQYGSYRSHYGIG